MPVIQDIDQERIVILDGKSTRVHVFANGDFRHVFSFGKTGQGPSEFLWINHIKSYPGKFLVFGSEKIAYYNNKGSYNEERKVPYGTSTFWELGDYFVCKKFQGSTKTSVITVKLLDNDFDEIKDLYTYEEKLFSHIAENNKQNQPVFRHYFGFEVDKGNIYIGDTMKGFYFCVFNETGNKIREINREFNKLPVTSLEKEDHMKRFRNALGKSRFENALRRNNYLYPDYFPAYKNFKVNDGKIYVITYRKEADGYEMVILNDDGKLIKTAAVPVRDFFNDFVIYNGTYFYLMENPEKETWELHAITLL